MGTTDRMSSTTRCTLAIGTPSVYQKRYPRLASRAGLGATANDVDADLQMLVVF